MVYGKLKNRTVRGSLYYARKRQKAKQNVRPIKKTSPQLGVTVKRLVLTIG